MLLRYLLEQHFQSLLPPDQLAWCGSDSLLLYWDDMLMMVGPFGEPVKYIYDEPIILIPECDGTRILSNTTMEFLHRVPDSTVSIFQIGSTSPPALLYDALENFDKRSSKVVYPHLNYLLPLVQYSIDCIFFEKMQDFCRIVFLIYVRFFFFLRILIT